MKQASDAPESIDHNGALLPAVPVASAARITDGVRLVSRAVAAWHPGGDAPLHLVCILNGARRFAADLRYELAKLNVTTRLHEIKISSTAGDRVTGRATLEKGDLRQRDFEGGRALIVDDIIDTGATAARARDLLKSMGVAEVRLAVAVNKWKDLSHLADYTVLDLGLDRKRMPLREGRPTDFWLFGYGMDLNGRFRECAGIAYVEVAV